MKIVFCASEAVPFAKTGGLADVSGALPLALEKEGQEIAMIMPGYKCIHENKQLKLKKLKGGISYSKTGKKIKVYFIDNEQYFGRDSLYGDKSGDYPDNLERFSYYCKRALELLKEINLKADIIHCHDWQAAFIPLYLKNLYANDSFYGGIKTMFTIHNIGYQGLFPKEEFPKLGLDWGLFNMEMLEFYDRVNILKGGIIFSDVITTVSDTYSKEIQGPEFGFGMEGILAKRKDSLFGILNGVDYSIWDPATDKFIFKKFSLKTTQDKYENKLELQKLCNLPQAVDVPLIGMVSRLAQPKGFDILVEGIEEIVNLKIQMVILGIGDLKYHRLLEDIAKKYPKIFSLHLKFDDRLAHRIYAGSDIFLMPSKYEPCGLGQLISLKYGTIPVVFRTGGLADTVDKSNGFVFDNYDKEGLVNAIKGALKAYVSKKKWDALVRRAMGYDFSWKESAKKYIKLYAKACRQ